ncbi:cell wall-binding repeat-containing protein [Clostridioides sp. ES-S-0006-03]|uniref:cell wall-binding repeat-containing protein n=1 Tax=Clostridioides sp. ES-S-0006-03 TaxID=2770775 RepID=UPI0025595E48|nr:cell wall-binding repeat-containing protein [Clostridioides sp. ES-S-0006-03]
MKISKKIVSLLTITFLSITLCGNTSNASTKDTLTGSGRWETAIKISQSGWTKSDNVVLVNDNSIADALSATPFAKAKDAPILLTQSNKLDDRTKIELKRLGVKNVYLIGGTNTLDVNVEKQLKAEKISFDRVSGNNRYETSLKLAEKLSKEEEISNIVVVNGEKGLADAVSVGSAAAQENMPIILSDTTTGIKDAEKFIKEKNIKKSYIVGGIYSVSDSVERSLPNSKRIAGNNRNETNAKVIEEFYKNTDLKNVYITKDGMKKQSDLIDSLAVGVLAAKNSSPVVLVGNKLDFTQTNVLNTKIIKNIVQVGGLGNENAVESIIDSQEETTYTVKNTDELNVAIKKSDANDTIKFKPEKEKNITESFKIETDKSISIELEGKYTQTISINMPNGSITNIGDVDGTIKIMDIKSSTLVNKGEINYLDIYDNNGCRVENERDGDIWLVTISNESKDVHIENDGDISKISNSCSSVTIKNSGNIDTLSGSKEIAISGSKPKVDDTDKDDEKASGINVKVEPCSIPKRDYVKVKIVTEPKNSNYKIYYKVVSKKPTSKYVGDKIKVSEWDDAPYSGTSFEVEARNGFYIEAVEINTSTNKISKWGRSDSTDDGFKSTEVAKGLSANVFIDGDKVELTTTRANSGCEIYYRITSSKPTAMNVGSSITLSSWEKISSISLELESSEVNGKYVELVELENSTDLVTRWGTTEKIVTPSSNI